MTSRKVLLGRAVAGLIAAAAMLCLYHAPARAAQPPNEPYEAFSRFCAEHFAAEKEPEMYAAFGRELKFVPAGTWRHVSEASACVAWETNLPASGYVEYGPTAKYGRRTAPAERRFFLHVHYLRGLRAGARYHYRFVAVDERGKRLVGPDETFTTRRTGGAVRVPGTLAGPPYVLDKPDTTYLLTRDIAADGTTVFIAASGITLDLGGHTVTYDRKRDAAGEGACGVRGHKTRGIGLSNVAVVNGTVRRGDGGSATRKAWDTLYNPVFFSRPTGLDIAGLTVDYHGVQVVAVMLLVRGQRCRIHHNVLVDRGTALFDRHLGMDAIALGTAASRCDHNLIKRTRHRGIKAMPDNEVAVNEIYVDSHATNSYGVMYYDNRGARKLAIRGNRIFGTGFHPVGIGSGQGFSDVEVSGNYIQMQGTSQRWRWRGGAGGGDPGAAEGTAIYPVNGIRLQRPGGNIVHRGNVVVVRGSGRTCSMRGLWLVPGEQAAEGIVLRDNRVKVVSQDGKATGCAISAGGRPGARHVSTVLLAGNTVASNLVNVQFGDNYSCGGKYRFEGNTFVRLGADERYRTFRLGWSGWKYETFGHVLIDSKFAGGAGYESISFDGARRGRYDLSAGWTLEVEAPAGASVTVRDRSGAEAFAARAGEDGKVAATLIQQVCRRGGATGMTPHTVTVEKASRRAAREVTMDRPRRIRVVP